MTRATTSQITGREYLRVSVDHSGRSRSVNEQHGDNEKAAAERGVMLRASYADNDVSASRYTKKVRDDFTKLLADLDKGRFDADELWLWESSRGSRRVGEWVQLIDACEQAGVGIYVFTHNRLYDPANGRDRRTLLEDAVDNEYESSKVSVRARRASAANAAAGRPNGATPYGYRRIYDPETRRLVRQEPHPDEAPVIRELFDRIRAGHSLRSIAVDFEARDIRTRPRTRDGVEQLGKVFTAQHLRSMAMTAHYVGLRVHQPKQTASPRTRHRLNGAVKGIWEPLVSDETFYDVRRILTRPERKTTRAGRAVHLLSMIARCAVCEAKRGETCGQKGCDPTTCDATVHKAAPLVVTRRSNGKNQAGHEQYQCNRKGCVRLDKAELDTLAEEAILTYLSKPDVFPGINAAAGGDDEITRVRGDLAAARAELDELRDNVSIGRLSVANLTAVGPGLEARVAELDAQEKELSTPSVLRGLIRPGKNARRDWRTLPIAARREVTRMVLSPEHVGLLTVTRRPGNTGRRHVPAQERVEWQREG